MKNTSILNILRTSRIVPSLIFPFVFFASLEPLHANEVLLKEKHRKDHIKKVAASRNMDTDLLLHPDEHLERLAKLRESRQKGAVQLLSQDKKLPDHTRIKAKHFEKMRQKHLSQVFELQSAIEHMTALKKAKKLTSMEWKTLSLKLATLRSVSGRLKQELKQETQSLGKRGVGFFKRWSYSSQREKIQDLLNTLPAFHGSNSGEISSVLMRNLHVFSGHKVSFGPKGEEYQITVSGSEINQTFKL